MCRVFELLGHIDFAHFTFTFTTHTKQQREVLCFMSGGSSCVDAAAVFHFRLFGHFMDQLMKDTAVNQSIIRTIISCTLNSTVGGIRHIGQCGNITVVFQITLGCE